MKIINVTLKSIAFILAMTVLCMTAIILNCRRVSADTWSVGMFAPSHDFVIGRGVQKFLKGIKAYEPPLHVIDKVVAKLYWSEDPKAPKKEQKDGVILNRYYTLTIELVVKKYENVPSDGEPLFTFEFPAKPFHQTDMDTDYFRYVKGVFVADMTDYRIARFSVNGGSPSVGLQGVKSGQKFKVPKSPTRPGYTFDGWWTDVPSGSVKFDFNKPVSQDVNLIAKWVAIPPATTTTTTTTTPATTPIETTPLISDTTTDLTDPLTTLVPEESTSSIDSDETVPDTTLPEESSTTTSETETAVAVVDDEPSNPKWMLFVGIGLIVILGTLMTWLIVVAKKQRRNDTNNQSGPNNPNRPNTPYPPSGQTGQYPQRNQYPLGNRGQQYSGSSSPGQYPPYQPYPSRQQSPPAGQGQPNPPSQ